MLCRLACSVAVLAALASLAAGQSVRLSGALAEFGGEDVWDYALSADQAWVAFRADMESPDVFELYVAPSDGAVGAERRNAPLAAGGGVVAFWVAGARALNRADQDQDERFELFSVPLDGSAPPVRLNAALAAGADVTDAWPSRDGSLVFFAVSDPAAQRERLMRVPADGSLAAVEIADSGFVSGATTEFVALQLSHDATRAVYTIDASAVGWDAEMFALAVDGSGAPLPLGTGTVSVRQFVLSADGSRLGFVETDGDSGPVYAQRTDGTALVQLSTAPGWQVKAIAADGSWVVFMQGAYYVVWARSDGSQSFIHAADGFLYGDPNVRISPDEAYLVFLGAGIRSLLIGTTTTNLLAPAGHAAEIAPSSDFIVYAQHEGEFTGLIKKGIAGGSVRLLNAPVAPNRVSSFALGGNRVVYMQEKFATGPSLYSARLDAVEPERLLCPELENPRGVWSFLLAADVERVIYRADQRRNDTYELFSVLYDGSEPPVRLHRPLSGGIVIGDVAEFAYGGAGDRVLYLADRDLDDQKGAFAAALDQTGPPLFLSPDKGSIQFGVLTPDGDRAVFATQRVIYVAPTHGDAAPLELGSLGIDVREPLLIPAGETRVVYRLLSGGTTSLASAPLDGSSPPVRLHPTPLTNSQVQDPQATPDGATIVYRADHGQLGVHELYRVPVDGSAAPVRVSATLPAAGDVSAFTLSPGGTRALYLADATVDERFELWSVPLDGSLAPVTLNGALPAGGDVTTWLVAPNGADVFYRADQTADGTFELFRTPIAGGAAPVLLTPLPAGGRVRVDLAVSADGTQLFYRADPSASNISSLFRVATDGLSAPVVVHGPLAGTILSFALSPAQDWLVYQGDERVAGVTELYRVPPGGGATVVVDPMPASGDVTSFEIAPDASLVVYRADRDTNGVLELFGAPLDGSAPPRRLSGPMVPGGEVHTGYRALSGGRVLYLADQNTDEVVELFLGGLGHARPRRLR